jgi:hypothetical protein
MDLSVEQPGDGVDFERGELHHGRRRQIVGHEYAPLAASVVPDGDALDVTT